ncbi:hypothetical protein ACJX0J_022290, partial [Zea mays]
MAWTSMYSSTRTVTPTIEVDKEMIFNLQMFAFEMFFYHLFFYIACISLLYRFRNQLTLETLDNIMNIHEILLPIFIVIFVVQFMQSIKYSVDKMKMSSRDIGDIYRYRRYIHAVVITEILLLLGGMEFWEHFNKGDLSQIKRDLRLNLKEIIRLNLFALKKPIKKGRANNKSIPPTYLISSPIQKLARPTPLVIPSMTPLSKNNLDFCCGQLAIIFLWTSGNLFHVAWQGNFESWIQDPLHVRPIAHAIWDPHFGQPAVEAFTRGGVVGPVNIAYSGVYQW